MGKMAVEQREWLDEEMFRDGVALCQTIPEATAMQVPAYVGLRARGLPEQGQHLSVLVFRHFLLW